MLIFDPKMFIPFVNDVKQCLYLCCFIFCKGYLKSRPASSSGVGLEIFAKFVHIFNNLELAESQIFDEQSFSHYLENPPRTTVASRGTSPCGKARSTRRRDQPERFNIFIIPPG